MTRVLDVIDAGDVEVVVELGGVSDATAAVTTGLDSGSMIAASVGEETGVAAKVTSLEGVT